MLKIVVFSALGLLVAVLLAMWLITRVRYRIGSKHVKVLLFGIPIRRIPLAKIESISKRAGDGLTERWWSTLRPKHRILVLRRRGGIFRNVMLTPKNRYIFKIDVERAIDRLARKTGLPQPNRPLPSASSEADNLEDGEQGAPQRRSMEPVPSPGGPA